MYNIVDIIFQLVWMVLTPVLAFAAFATVILVGGALLIIAWNTWSYILWMCHGVWDGDIYDQHERFVGNTDFKGWYSPIVVSQTSMKENVIYDGQHGRQCVVTFVGLYEIPELFRNGIITARNIFILPGQRPMCVSQQQLDEFRDNIIKLKGSHELTGSNVVLSAKSIQTFSIFCPYGTPSTAISVV